jgi:hypothetical protein
MRTMKGKKARRTNSARRHRNPEFGNVVPGFIVAVPTWMPEKPPRLTKIEARIYPAARDGRPGYQIEMKQAAAEAKAMIEAVSEHSPGEVTVYWVEPDLHVSQIPLRELNQYNDNRHWWVTGTELGLPVREKIDAAYGIRSNPSKRRKNGAPKRDEIVRRQKKPAAKGSFVGQAITSQERVDTGKFRYIPMPPEIAARYYREGKEPPEKLKVAVVETQTITHWLWDGRDWVRPEDYDVPAEEMPYSAASRERVLREEARKRAGREMTEAYVPPPAVPERKAAPKMTKQQKKLLASFKR